VSTGFFYGQYIDLAPYFDKEPSTTAYMFKALKAGYLPLSTSCVTDFLTYAINCHATYFYTASGNTDRTYAFVRTSSYLSIYYCAKTIGQITSNPSSSTSG
jgi:hypothetical protein